MSGGVSARMEDYLEAILLLQERQPVTRAAEVAGMLGVTRPSVTAALKVLVGSGLIEHQRYGYVRLTPRGRKAAQMVSRRHVLLRGFLRDVLGMRAELAAEDACRIEHHISGDAMERLTRFVRFVGACPRCGSSWLKHLVSYCGGSRRQPSLPRCTEPCLSDCLKEVQSHRTSAKPHRLSSRPGEAEQ